MKTQFTSEKEFINEIALSAQKACKRYGYLPSVLIAQACLENGYGIPSYWDNPQIKYLLQYNNMVGQKAALLNSSWYDKTVWPGKSFNKKTPEQYSNAIVIIQDDFRIFDSIEQSFCDFLLFLLYASNEGYNKTPKYGKEVVNIKDPELLITTVANRGYATGKTYPISVMKIINKHNLTQYDDLSNIQASNYIPEVLKRNMSNIKTIEDKVIHDITQKNKNQVPDKRGRNQVEYIVIHYLGVPNADNPNLYGGGYGGHYNIQMDGQIFCAADPEKDVVWHCGGKIQGEEGHLFYGLCTNYNSVGIENSARHTDASVKSASIDSDQWYFTEETQESLIFLVSFLMDKFNIPLNHVIRHFDVTGKICPNPYVKNNNLKTSWTWEQFKNNLVQYRKDKTITIPVPQEKPKKNYLSKGDKGEQVKHLQELLIFIGYSCGAAGADGDFGVATNIALTSFQQDNGLEPDGCYGANSKKKLIEIYNQKIKQQKAIKKLKTKAKKASNKKDDKYSSPRYQTK